MRAVETILRARLLQKVNILQQRTVPLLLLRTYIRFSPRRCLYGLSRNPKEIIDKSKCTSESVLLERHFSSGNTAVPVTRLHALSSHVIIHK